MDKHIVTTQYAETVIGRYRDILEPYLSRVGIDRAVLTDPDAELDDRKFVELLELVAKEQDDMIGLHMASGLKCRDWGIYGHAIINAPDLRTAIQVMAEYITVFSQVVDERIIESDETISITYRVSDDSIVFRRQDSEFAVASILMMLREATGIDIELSEVRFEHAKPKDAHELKEFFGRMPIFNQPQNAIVFDRSVFETPMANPDPRLFELFQRHLTERLAERRVEHSVIVKASFIIAQKLADGVPSLFDVANAMHLSERTLQRRCSDHGMDFLHLVDQVRHQIAVQHLKYTNDSLTDIAFKLGYSQISAFSRAFRRWTGVSPMRYRRLYSEEND